MTRVLHMLRGSGLAAAACVRRGLRADLLVAGLVFATLTAVVALWLFATVLPCRTPPLWDEADYISTAYRVRAALAGPPANWVELLLSTNFCVCHRTLVGASVAVPLLGIMGMEFAALNVAACVMLLLTCCLMAVVVWRDHDDGMAGAVGGGIAAMFFLSSPIALATGSMFMSETPVVLASAMAVAAYVLARRREGMAVWIVASCVLFVSLYARAERGVFFIAGMFGVYCCDEYARKGWRDGLGATATFAGLGIIAGLWAQDWIPGYQRISPTALAANMLGVVLLVPWCALLHRSGTAPRRALCYGGPATLLLLLWFSHDGNIAYFLKIFSWLAGANASVGDAANAEWYPFWRFAGDHCASAASLWLKVVLLATGLVAVGRRSPGLAFLFVFYLAQMLRLKPYTGPRYMHQLVFVAALVAGHGAAWVFQIVMRLVSRYRPGKRQVGVAVAMFALMCAVAMPGLFPGARRAYERTDVLGFWVLFDPTRAMREVLDVLDRSLGTGATVHCVITTCFDSSMLSAYSSLKERQWQIAHLNSKTGAFELIVGADWAAKQWPSNVVVLLPGTRTNAYMDTYPQVRDHLSLTAARIDALPCYRRMVDQPVGNTGMVLRIYTLQDVKKEH